MKRLDKNKGIVFWITGLPGSGKTRIAKKIRKPIEKIYGETILFSGDDLRKILNFKSYDVKKRLIYAKSYSKLVQNISNQKINVIIATVALFKKIHLWNRKNIKNYCEIYIKSSAKEIIKNKKKKLYFRYKKNLVGIDIAPEFPSKSNIKILNNFKKPIVDLSESVLKKINLLYES
jgi:cytidine diphosphoramidate kinase